MIIAKRLKGKAIAAYLGSTGDAARRALAGIKSQWQKTSQRLDVYIDAGDPWSYLTAQVASRLVDAYPVDLAVHVVTPPASDVNGQPTLRLKHAVRDAQLLAEYWNIEFAGKKEADPVALREVNSALIRPRPARDQLRAALELMGALWQNDRKAVTKLLGTWGSESTGSIAPILASSYEELRKAGHYQGAMIAYAGEWYSGIDRLPYLEAQLAKDFGVDVAHVLTPRSVEDRGPLALSQKPLSCEMWFSYRSPYSYLALERIEETLAPFGVPLVLRPVLPMIFRGHTVPTIKRLYMARDAKREADRLGIAFGEICEADRPAIDNLLTLSLWANGRGALLAFARSAMRGIWAEARDLTEYVDLRHVVERAGLPWQEARDVLAAPAAGEEATKWASANAADLAVIGLWGVPSLRCGDLVAWGQDRLPLLADRLRRHAAAPAPEPEPLQNPS